MCIEAQNNNSIPLVLQSTNFLEAFESRLAWLSNEGATPQDPDRIGINYEEITEIKLLFPALFAYQIGQNQHGEDSEYLELWATPCNLYRDPHAPHYSLSWSLEHLVNGNSFDARAGLRIRRSYVFVDQDQNFNLLLNDKMFEFRRQEVLSEFMNRYRVSRIFVNPDNHYSIAGNLPMTCITQTGFWEAKRKEELAAVAMQCGICNPYGILRFVSIASGLMKSDAHLSLQQLSTMIKDMEDG